MSARSDQLWADLDGDKLTGPARVMAIEAVRLADRLDTMDAFLAGDEDAWHRLSCRLDGQAEVVLDKGLSEARQHALALATVLVALAKLTGEAKVEAPKSAADDLAARRKEKQREAREAARAAE